MQTLRKLPTASPARIDYCDHAHPYCARPGRKTHAPVRRCPTGGDGHVGEDRLWLSAFAKAMTLSMLGASPDAVILPSPLAAEMICRPGGASE